MAGVESSSPSIRNITPLVTVKDTRPQPPRHHCAMRLFVVSVWMSPRSMSPLAGVHQGAEAGLLFQVNVFEVQSFALLPVL